MPSGKHKQPPKRDEMQKRSAKSNTKPETGKTSQPRESPITGAKYKSAREAYEKLHTLIKNPSSSMHEIDDFLNDKKNDKIFWAINTDLHQLSELLKNHVQVLTALVSNDNQTPESGKTKSAGNGHTGVEKDGSGIEPNDENKGVCVLEQLRIAIGTLGKQLDRQGKEAVKSLGQLDTKTLFKCGNCESLEKKIERKFQVQIDELKQEKEEMMTEENKIERKFQVQIDELKQEKEEMMTDKCKQDAQITKLKQHLETLNNKEHDILHEKESVEDDNKRLRKKLQSHEARERKADESLGITQGSQTTEVTKLKEYVRQMEMWLAADMSSKVAADESSLENISIKNRPMNIASDYEQFCSQSWLTIKTFLDEKMKKREDEKVKFLAEVLMVSENRAGQPLKEIKQRLAIITGQDERSDKVKAPRVIDFSKIEVTISDVFRVYADKMDLTWLEKSIQEEVKTLLKKYQNMKDFKGEPANLYICECARLTWKMVIQRPAMRFEAEIGIDWRKNEKVVEPAWGSNPESDKARIRYYRHPILYHGKGVMVKGKAIIT